MGVWNDIKDYAMNADLSWTGPARKRENEEAAQQAAAVEAARLAARENWNNKREAGLIDLQNGDTSRSTYQDMRNKIPPNDFTTLTYPEGKNPNYRGKIFGEEAEDLEASERHKILSDYAGSHGVNLIDSHDPTQIERSNIHEELKPILLKGARGFGLRPMSFESNKKAFSLYDSRSYPDSPVVDATHEIAEKAGPKDESFQWGTHRAPDVVITEALMAHDIPSRHQYTKDQFDHFNNYRLQEGAAYQRLRDNPDENNPYTPKTDIEKLNAEQYPKDTRYIYDRVRWLKDPHSYASEGRNALENYPYIKRSIPGHPDNADLDAMLMAAKLNARKGQE